MEIDAKASASPQTTPSSPAPTLTKRINPVWPPEQKENVSMKNCGLYCNRNKKENFCTRKKKNKQTTQSQQHKLANLFYI